MLALTGIAVNIRRAIVGVVTTRPVKLSDRRQRIFVSHNIVAPIFGYACCITSWHIVTMINGKMVHSVLQLQTLSDGDVVLITPEGKINVMYQSGHKDHTVFATNQCNSQCVMCLKTQSKDPADLYEINQKVLSFVKTENLNHIVITGGEPTVVLEQLCQTLAYLQRYFSETLIYLLSNGRRFWNLDVAKQVVNEKNKKLFFCIPLYADSDVKHDAIVGVVGAFQETIQGIYNLYHLRARIEIRIIVMRQNFERLTAIAEFIHRNMPFVSHVAFMGMEYVEDEEQLDHLWIDPKEYKQELYEAVWHLHQRGMVVSIYNIPLCVSEPLWKFSRDSIFRYGRSII